MTRERYRGALLGLAAGDALGTTLEFKPPGTFAPLADMIGGGPFHLKPGEWTDDTSMALCLAESLVERNGFDAKDQMDRCCLWYERGHLSSVSPWLHIMQRRLSNPLAAKRGLYCRCWLQIPLPLLLAERGNTRPGFRFIASGLLTVCGS
jgi:ADP-ribosylglycohydrolase